MARFGSLEKECDAENVDFVMLDERTIGEKLLDLLERKPENYDVLFSVGPAPDQKVVRGLKINLKAASPYLEREFEERWESLIREKVEIQLPDFEPEAFQLFIKLNILDTWKAEDLDKLYLAPDQVLSLISICRRFEIKAALRNLEELAKIFFQSFHRFKEADEFLKISRANLENILASDELGMDETEVFKSAIRWAEHKCKELGREATGNNLRYVLGDCIFQIRFPLFSTTEFTKVARLKSLLTPDETLGLYTYLGLEDNEKLNYNKTHNKLAFKTHRREPRAEILYRLNLQSALKSAASLSMLPAGCTTLRLTKAASFDEDDDDSSFTCNGTWCNENRMYTSQNIELCGLGFFGPVDTDSYYDITVEVAKRASSEDTCSSGKLEKRVYARKGQNFHFVFDEPIPIQSFGGDMWGDYYDIRFSLKGPNTSQRREWSIPTLEADGIQFRFLWGSKQLVEILFKKPAPLSEKEKELLQIKECDPPPYDKSMEQYQYQYLKKRPSLS